MAVEEFRYANGMTRKEYEALYRALPTPTQTLSLNDWTRYRDILAKINEKAADEFRDAVFNINGRWHGVGLGKIPRDELIEYAYGLITKYGEGSAAAACMAYDEMAALSGVTVPPAVPAETATYSEVAKNINGTLKVSENEELLTGVVSRLVKQAGQDTTVQNAARDGAEYAWIPSGLTCPYCIALASRGWQKATNADKYSHVEHIHANCDCAYQVRFNKDTEVEGYNPAKYLRMYKSADGKTSKEKLNAMAREAYEQNGDAGGLYV